MSMQCCCFKGHFQVLHLHVGREEQFDHLLMPIFARLLEGSHNFGVGNTHCVGMGEEELYNGVVAACCCCLQCVILFISGITPIVLSVWLDCFVLRCFGSSHAFKYIMEI